MAVVLLLVLVLVLVLLLLAVVTVVGKLLLSHFGLFWGEAHSV